MTFWIVAALLTAAACLAVMWPFLRRQKAAAAGHDLEVYRDQLDEVDRDLERGAISPAEAGEAKAEIGRRILRAAEADGITGVRTGTTAARLTASAAVLAVPALALAFYVALGSPWMPDQSLEARLAANPAQNSIDELMARAERHLVENPQDGRGWDVLAPIYLRVGRNEDAVIAFRNTIRLNGATAEREAGLGDALYRAAGNVVTSEAQAAFKRALQADGANPRARFFLALGLAQQNEMEEAADAWRAMLGDLPADSPWRGAAAEALARAEQSMPSEAVPGPTADDMQAATGMSEEDRNAMIEGMVEQLDQRLRDNPDDPAGWQRLIRSYVVLGRTDEARAALERGLGALGAGDGRALVEFAAGLGIERAESQ
jgi:cytochrome c-type biogenesis protein CcmH